VSQVFRGASLELWHNAPDIDNYLNAIDPVDHRELDEGEWFLRIAHNFARDYIERHGNLDQTAHGVFNEYVRKQLGFWGRLGFRRDKRLPELVMHFHETLQGLPIELKRVLEEDLNTDLLVAGERRLGETHPDRRKAVGFLRHSLGLK
jgi:hypothetical protein